MNIGIYIYDQAEVLDFSGPYEVFSTAARLQRAAGEEPEKVLNPFLICENKTEASVQDEMRHDATLIVARAGYRVIADFDFNNHPPLDVLVVVGGVHQHEMEKSRVLNWIKQKSEHVKLLASVCTGVFILAKSGAMDTACRCAGKPLKVTTHWEDIPDLRKQFPDLQVVENVRWVDEGTLVTSGGISAGIDMSLYLVSKMTEDPDLAKRTAKQMEFFWDTTH